MTLTNRAPRRAVGAADALWVVLAAGVLGRLAVPGLWRVPTVQAWTLVFGAVCVQAAPYVVLGVLLSTALGLVPDRWIRGVLPRRASLAVPVAATIGAALPGCECGSVPVAVSLLRRGVSTGPAVGLMLSAPATNPVVLAATAAAFPGRPGVVVARFVASWCVAVGTGWCVARRSAPPALGAVCSHGHARGPGHGHGLDRSSLVATTAHDLAQSLGLVTVGAASAATVGVLVPPAVLTALAGTAVGGVLASAVLAVVLAVCSEADAFIASSLVQFSTTAQLVFMVVGPVVDVKLVAMHVGAFGRRFAARLGATAFTLAVGSAVLLGWACT
ncbi:permease [Jatrophihabitans endophyticus]|uniref:permease n=1 Tax=Jatrophihabitans endophyticus TaxID=1206085 RepID=UPI001A089D03|nr:permease [Jatrophihabitans endophyticus]MBE7187914.1 permease [Jatrophihabitans endophyticus]